MKELEDILNQFEQAESTNQLSAQLDYVIQKYGFSTFSYVDIRKIPSLVDPLPFFQTTVCAEFSAEYNRQKFLSYDPVLRRASLTNKPFSWWECSEFAYSSSGGKKTKAKEIIQFARDFGYTDGYTIPIHSVDRYGNKCSALLTLYWKEKNFIQKEHKVIPIWLRLAALVFHEKMIELRDIRNLSFSEIPTLTDRERDCLLWACRGKTQIETAMILNITERTVEFHLANVMKKLNVKNKTHAIAQAIYLGLIVP